MAVDRTWVSSFAEAAFVCCVQVYQATFVLLEMLHAGGTYLHSQAS